MTIATLPSVSAPLAGAAVRRLFPGWGRRFARAQAKMQAGALAGMSEAAFGSVPARRWPFPPQQPAAQVPVDGGKGQAAPTPADVKRPAASDGGLGDVRSLSTVQALGIRRMVIDVLLVAVWGALIPALMWLGAAAGF